MQTNSTKIIISSEAITLDGDWESITVSQEWDIPTLIALGHNHQTLICEELDSLLNQEFESNPNYIGLGDTYLVCKVGKLNISLDGSEFIPRLRGLYQRRNYVNQFNNFNLSKVSTPQLHQYISNNPVFKYAESVGNMDTWEVAKLAIDHTNGNLLPHQLTADVNYLNSMDDFETDECSNLLVEKDNNWFRITYTYINGDPDVGKRLIDVQIYESNDMSELTDFYRDIDVNDYESFEEVNGKHY